MENFLEKLKDLLYDGVDYIIMIAIVIAVILIINWRLDGLFAQGNVDLSTESSTSVEENESKNSKPSDENGDQTKTDTESKEKESNMLVKIDIPAGSASSDIGDILIAEGLIEEKDSFLKQLTQLNLETKLRQGQYEVPKGSSLEEILNIITK